METKDPRLKLIEGLTDTINNSSFVEKGTERTVQVEKAVATIRQMFQPIERIETTYKGKKAIVMLTGRGIIDIALTDLDDAKELHEKIKKILNENK